MNRILAGQGALIVCCIFYLIWWYRGYRPGVTVNRVGGVNGLLFAMMVVLGVIGVVFSLTHADEIRARLIPSQTVIIAAVIGFIVLLVITYFCFHRSVTTELFLITLWTALEVGVTDRLYAAGGIGHGGLTLELVIIAVAFAISMVLYVLYYRMEENAAFYAAMVPIVTEALAMASMIIITKAR